MRNLLIGLTVVISCTTSVTTLSAGSCNCLQFELWDTSNGNAMYYAFRYTWPSGDTDCTNDPAQGVFHEAAKNQPPQTYCPGGPSNPGTRCNNCILTPPTDKPTPLKFEPQEPNYVFPDSPDGQSWNRLNTTFVKYRLPGDTSDRYAKLFILKTDRIPEIFAFGVEVKRVPPGVELKTVNPSDIAPLDYKFWWKDSSGRYSEEEFTDAKSMKVGPVTYHVRMAL